MKRFGLKGKSVRIEVILAIVVLLLVLCMGFGYCLRFTHREGADIKVAGSSVQWLPPADSKMIVVNSTGTNNGYTNGKFQNPLFFEWM